MGGALIKTDLGYGRGWASPKAAASIKRIDAQLGRPADINEAGRSPEQANENRRRWLAYERYLKGGPWAPKAPYALGAEDSVHCAGDAADSDDWYDPHAAAVWRDNGWRQTARYFDRAGRPTAKDEPWHGEHFEHLDNHSNDPAAAGHTATPQEEDDMPGPDKKLVLWRGAHYFVIGDESIYHVADPGWLPYLRDHYGPRGKELAVDNGALTVELVINKIPWDAVDACLLGRAFGADRRSWSRLQAEGVAIRGQQATAQKTLEDVLKTATRIEQDG